MELIWSSQAWEDYLWWQRQDRKVLKRINTLLKDIQRNGNEGIGKPEALRNNLSGYWSRRITEEHRLVYKIVGNSVRIAAVRYHYE
ncbi:MULTISPECIES: Txe/YoeB family addiction module toxin [Rothia]|uniref:Txe/YoeB family addiction module toxin n=1 Tax=Rothia TaxID=32207 RepID=UPI0016294223|nr:MULTISPECIES: Txe/YoeB family addiction module toxin [Rothia]MDY6050894.1 Txe/YoeB family addiction module toxin [Rothia sp. (in: high G+C Gram-positive bacteria)]